MRLLPESATKMLSSESTKRCQGSLICPAPTIRQNCPEDQRSATYCHYSQPPQYSHSTEDESRGLLHLTISLSFRPKLPHKLTTQVDYLNAAVARISHDIISLRVNNNTTWVRELPITLGGCFSQRVILDTEPPLPGFMASSSEIN